MRALLHRLSGLRAERRIDREIGRRMRSLRLQAGVSLADLATEAGLPIEELADHEDGTLPIPISRALLLCRALGIDLRDLLPAGRAEGGSRGSRGS